MEKVLEVIDAAETSVGLLDTNVNEAMRFWNDIVL